MHHVSQPHLGTCSVHYLLGLPLVYAPHSATPNGFVLFVKLKCPLMLLPSDIFLCNTPHPPTSPAMSSLLAQVMVPVHTNHPRRGTKGISVVPPSYRSLVYWTTYHLTLTTVIFLIYHPYDVRFPNWITVYPTPRARYRGNFCPACIKYPISSPKFILTGGSPSSRPQ